MQFSDLNSDDVLKAVIWADLLQRQSQGINVPAVVVPELPEAVNRMSPELREFLTQQNELMARTAHATALNWRIDMDQVTMKKEELEEAERRVELKLLTWLMKGSSNVSARSSMPCREHARPFFQFLHHHWSTARRSSRVSHPATSTTTAAISRPV